MSSLFPFMDSLASTVESVSSDTNIYKEYGIDFETGRLTGKVVEGKEALKVWIYKALKTPRYIHDIYTWDYGQDLEELIGQGYDKGYVNSEAERRIKDVLSINEKINSCYSFDVDFSKDQLVISFTVDSIYGEVSISGINI